ncbi:MAG: hypothetical protein J3Q66DRAFT_125445 [Benniella sp.]|nr:MAG: hypothetical protein J3Q66DRAFT_125445 [Benniella sp.]
MLSRFFIPFLGLGCSGSLPFIGSLCCPIQATLSPTDVERYLERIHSHPSIHGMCDSPYLVDEGLVGVRGLPGGVSSSGTVNWAIVDDDAMR